MHVKMAHVVSLVFVFEPSSSSIHEFTQQNTRWWSSTITKETTYNFHVDTASSASDLISQTARNAKEMSATVEKVKVTEENQNSYENPYGKLSDREILDLLLTK